MANGGTVYWRIGALEMEVRELRKELQRMRTEEAEEREKALEQEKARRQHESETRKMDRRAIWASAGLIIAAMIAATATMLSAVG